MSSAREQIVRILQSVTDISAAELGRRVGVSRERVRQILKDLGYPTARGKGRPFGSTVLSSPIRSGSGRIGKAATIRLVAEDLQKRGYAIFAPVWMTRTCDLIAVNESGAVELLRVTGTGRSRRGRVSRESKNGRRGSRGLSVRLAIVRDATIRYEPAFSTSRGRPAARN